MVRMVLADTVRLFLLLLPLAYVMVAR